jgi:aprataxin
MAKLPEDKDDITAEEVTQLIPKKRNAFAELMAPKKSVKLTQTQSASSVPSSSVGSSSKGNNWRGGLLDYIIGWEKFPSDVVLRVTPNTVLIRDMFPKATIHLLLLPRSPAHYNQHPRDAFEDSDFLTMIKEEAASAVLLAAAELRRLLSSHSASSIAHDNAIDAGVAEDQLPPDRDFSRDLRVGIHADPSMQQLHVHIISSDMHSDRLKHRKHYNSFNTSFFIPLSEFPLPTHDRRWESHDQNNNLKGDLVCWRCDKTFGNRFMELKKHLDLEFGEWRKI